MLPNDDLARWGELPTDEREMALAERLPIDLAEIGRWIDEMMDTVTLRSGVLENLPPPAAAGDQPRQVELRLSVSRLVGRDWRRVASTHARPCVVRDMRLVPDDADRVSLRTGERVRVEVACDTAGHVLVYNVGPRGAVHILHSGPVSASESIQILDAEMTPPAGRERVYAVWSRVPLAVAPQTRDLRLVEHTLAELPRDDWHAILLELDHQEPAR